jgi:GNAT superfamily N-acetyltransferase
MAAPYCSDEGSPVPHEGSDTAAPSSPEGAAIEIAPIDPAHPDAQYCLGAYYAELDARFEAGFDPNDGPSVTQDDMRPPAGLLLVARLSESPVACGALIFHHSDPPELKRLWVSPEARGIGLGRRMLQVLESLAAQHSATAIRLDSNRALSEALAMYRSAGYREIPAFNDDPAADYWFEKQLDPPPA